MSQVNYKFNSPNGIIKNKYMSNSSRLILVEAEKYGINWRIIPCTQLVELTYKKQKKIYYHQVPCTTSASAIYTCNNKKITSNVLSSNNIFVPCGYRIKKNSSKEYLHSIFNSLKKPLVLKPTNGAWGDNITINITNFDNFIRAISYAFEFSGKKGSTVIAEEMFEGIEYRILATNKKVIGILKRRPASILGNGKDSIKKLIQEKNKNPIRNNKAGTTSHLKIRMDEKMVKLLEENKLTFKSIPKKGERVFLRKVSNISKGGDAIDFTDVAHKSVKDIAIQAVQSIPGLTFAGVDFISKDITQNQTKDSYTIIEINSSPGLDIHDFPCEGKNRHAAKEFLCLMYPELKNQK